MTETAMVRPDNALKAILERMRIGPFQQDAGLAVAGLYLDDPTPTTAYVTLAQALAAGDVIVSEKPQASVPTLQIRNLGAWPVLLLDGEEVIGGRQNRVLNATIMVPPEAVFDLPVSCVEQSRWQEVSPTFDTGEAAYPTLRRAKMEQVAASSLEGGAPRADQSAIWEEIASRQNREGVQSPTSAMRDSYSGRADELASAEFTLRCPEDGPVGIIALVEGRAVCADFFDRPETLRGYWSRLIRSYALEAVDRPANEPDRASALRLIARPLKARLTCQVAPGLGFDVRVSGNGIVGASLVLGEAVVHTALFRKRTAASRGSIRRPSERRRHQNVP